MVENLFIESNNIKIIADNGEINDDEYVGSLRKFCEESGKEDLVIIYYTGHGIVYGEKNYLLVTNTFNEETGIDINLLVEYISRCKAKSKLIILDCCFADSEYSVEHQIRNFEKSIDELYQVGVSIFCSCKKNELSSPYYGEKTSAFTQFLCDAIKQKNIARGGNLYFNDVKVLVDIYAKVWNSRNPDDVQTPVMRSNMVGTIVFPLRNPLQKKTKMKFYLHKERFSIFDLKCEAKKSQKVYSAKVFANVDYKNSMKEFLSEVFETISRVSLTNNAIKRKGLENHPIDVILLWIGNDVLDMEENYYEYRAVWEREGNYWKESLGKESTIIGDIAFWKNKAYDRLKESRINDTFPDEELIEFWERNVNEFVLKYEEFLLQHRKYENKEINFNVMKKYAANAYDQLYQAGEEVFHALFAVPGSELKEFSDLSYDLVQTIREILMLYLSKRDENYIEDNFMIKLPNYYLELERWKNIHDIKVGNS